MYHYVSFFVSNRLLVPLGSLHSGSHWNVKAGKQPSSKGEKTAKQQGAQNCTQEGLTKKHSIIEGVWCLWGRVCRAQWPKTDRIKTKRVHNAILTHVSLLCIPMVVVGYYLTWPSSLFIASCISTARHPPTSSVCASRVRELLSKAQSYGESPD